jgi:branched-chain amino acid transport system substrate-binding protein
MGRRLVVVLAVTMVAAMIVPLAAAGAGKQDGPTGEPIKIGVVAQISGPAGGGDAAAGLYKSLQDEWNATLTSKDRPIQIVYEDGGLDSNLTRAASQKLITEENVVAMLGGNLIDCPVNSKFYQSAGVALLGSAQTTEQCYIPGTTFPLTRLSGSNGLTAALDWAEGEGKKVFGFIWPDAPGVKVNADALEAYGATKKDIKVVTTTVPLPPTAADWDAAIATLKSQGADVAMMLAQPEWTVTALEEADVQGFGPDDGITWISGPNMYDDDNLKAIPAMEGTYVMLTALPLDFESKGVKKAAKLFEGSELSSASGTSYDPNLYARKVIAKAAKSGEVTRESVLAAAKSIKKFHGVMVPTTVFPNDPSKDPIGAFIVKAENGKFVHASDEFIISKE